MKTSNTIVVYNNNIEKALRQLKKQTMQSKLLIEAKERMEYTKPSQRKKRKQAAATRRWKKYLTEQELPKKRR